LGDREENKSFSAVRRVWREALPWAELPEFTGRLTRQEGHGPLSWRVFSLGA
jgi:hypothetical protein